MTEVRIKNESTGGEKGAKPEKFSHFPWEALSTVARVYEFGSRKYAPHNFRKGYDWSLSFDAMVRHEAAFWSGEDLDPESGLPHIAHAVWHGLALLSFMQEHPELDDRHKQATKVDDDADWDVPVAYDEDIDYWPGFLDQDLRPGDEIISRAAPTAPVYFLSYSDTAPFDVRTVTSLEDPNRRGLHYYSEITHVNGMPVEPLS